MFLYISIIGISALTVYCMFFTFQKREKLTCMVGMMIAMIIGMMASVSIGTILGILLHDLELSTIVSVLAGMLAGYWTGKPVSLMASMDGMLAGIMGGLMGPMLGVMIDKPITIALFMDSIFLFVITLLIQMINEETGETVNNINSRISNLSFITIVVGIAIVGILYKYENTKATQSQDSNVHEHVHFSLTSHDAGRERP